MYQSKYPVLKIVNHENKAIFVNDHLFVHHDVTFFLSFFLDNKTPSTLYDLISN